MATANRLLSLSAAFKDADLGDIHKTTWSWGDGKQDPGIVSERNGNPRNCLKKSSVDFHAGDRTFYER